MLRSYYMPSTISFAMWTYFVAPGVGGWATILSGNMLQGLSTQGPAADGLFMLPVLVIGFYVFTIPIIVAYVLVLRVLQAIDWLNPVTAVLAAMLGIAVGLLVIYHGNLQTFFKNGSLGTQMLVGGFIGLVVAWIVCRWRGHMMPVPRFNPDYLGDVDP